MSHLTLGGVCSESPDLRVIESPDLRGPDLGSVCSESPDLRGCVQ